MKTSIVEKTRAQHFTASPPPIIKNGAQKRRIEVLCVKNAACDGAFRLFAGSTRRVVITPKRDERTRRSTDDCRRSLHAFAGRGNIRVRGSAGVARYKRKKSALGLMSRAGEFMVSRKRTPCRKTSLHAEKIFYSKNYYCTISLCNSREAYRHINRLNLSHFCVYMYYSY